MADRGGVAPISFEEYETAYRAFLRCMIDTGVGFVDMGFDPWSGSYQYATEADDDYEARTGRIPSDDCYDRHFVDVDRRWQFQVERDHLDRRWALAADFVIEHGVEIPLEIREHRDLRELRRHAASMIDEETLKAFGLSALDLR